MNKSSLNFFLSVVLSLVLVSSSVFHQSVFAVDGESEVSIVPETTETLCKDGVDNDFNLVSDAADPACSAFFPTDPEVASSGPEFSIIPETTEALCKDGVDNDFNLVSDAADPACSVFYPAPVATSTPTSTTPVVVVDNTNSGGATGGGSVGGSSFSSGGSSSVIPSTPTVLGAFTTSSSVGTSGTSSCSVYLHDYTKMGWKNNKEEVIKLQAFLNEALGLIDNTLVLNGTFDLKTDKAVRQYQAKYSSEILQPWVDAGLAKSAQPTGYAYITTVWHINKTFGGCKDIARPTLR